MFKFPVSKLFFIISRDRFPLAGKASFLSCGYIDPNPYKFFLGISIEILNAVAFALSPLTLVPPTFNSSISISILFGSKAGMEYSSAELCFLKLYSNMSFFFPSYKWIAGM